MVIINSLNIRPRHTGKIGIIIYDNLQAQEILKLNNMKYNTFYSITSQVRESGFVYEYSDGIKKWYFKTENNRIEEIEKYASMFSTNVYLEDISHFWICKDCLNAVPTTWAKCQSCKK